MTSILYSFRRCPYAMRARMALHISGEQYAHREVLLRRKPAAMLAASPKGTVPVFITEDGTVIDESLDLMLWALGRNDPENWLRNKPQDIEFIQVFETGFKDNLDRYKYASRYDNAKARGETDPRFRAKALDALRPFEAILTDQHYLGGQTRSLADMASFPFIRQFAAVEPDWWAGHDLSSVRAWLARHLASDIFKAIMTKHAEWSPDTQPPA